MEKSMMTINDLAATMGMGRHQAEKLAKSPGFPCITIGRRYFIPISEFQKWVHENSYATVPFKLD